MTEETIQEALDALVETPAPEHHYLETYDALAYLFESFKWEDGRDFHAAACAVYGWMPTMLRSQPDEAALRALLDCQTPMEVREACAKVPGALRAVNNSIVGTSKLLHFAKPDLFPILDGNVARALSANGSARISPEMYLTLVEVIPRIGSLPRAKDHTWLDEKTGWSKLRKIEFALFLVGKHRSR